MVLSGPSIEHAVMMIAAQVARAPYVPITPAYALLATDYRKLRHVTELCRPKLIFADDGEAFAPALTALGLDGVEIVTLSPARDLPTTPFADLLAAIPGPAVEQSLAQITPDTWAKVLFTSGSTGASKGVMHTQRVLTSSISQHEGAFIHDHDDDEPTPYLSWLPWSHTAASNILFGDVIGEAATLYVDDGKPVPGQFGETLRNLREIRLKQFSSTPGFYASLVAAMEAEPAFRDHFFSRLRYARYSTAALPQELLERFQALSIAATGRKTAVTTTYGSTETQGITLVSWPLEETGPVGTPFPGVLLKLAPVADKLEVRVKSDLLAAGYLGDPEATAQAYDEEGFYCTGDAARLVDPDDPAKGIAFDGRLVENFKLATGTWVSVGLLRVDVVNALAPLLRDCLIAGENRDEVTVLAWPALSDCAAVAGLPADASAAEIVASDRLRSELAERLRRYNAAAEGSARRVSRMLLLETPPAGDEIAEKGYVNQRAALAHRAADVARLYAKAPPDAEVIAGG
jgi:feruloyl-CoA synthase